MIYYILWSAYKYIMKRESTAASGLVGVTGGAVHAVFFLILLLQCRVTLDNSLASTGALGFVRLESGATGGGWQVV